MKIYTILIGLFKDAIEGHREMPSPNAWETINESLNKTKTRSIEQSDITG